MVLAASASYISWCRRRVGFAIPEARPAFYIGLSLGVTFPFNILVSASRSMRAWSAACWLKPAGGPHVAWLLAGLCPCCASVQPTLRMEAAFELGIDDRCASVVLPAEQRPITSITISSSMHGHGCACR